jgi:hypothetical protein
MFRLHVIQARFGDSLLLEFGTPQDRRHVLIDGGPPGCYAATLRPALDAIVGRGGTLDLVVLSHIDNDHIVGLLHLLADLEDDQVSGRPPRNRVGGLWHNSFSQTLDRTGEISQGLQALMGVAGAANVAMPLAMDAFQGLKEGNRLRLLARKLRIPANVGFDDDLILAGAGRQPIPLGPLTLSVIGPDEANLKALRAEWLDWLARTADKIASDPSAAATVDRSAPNLSSIVLLATCEGKRVLLTGDARGDHISAGLKLSGLGGEGRIHVDVLKVQHHGSARNANRDFFAAVTADCYVISADGKYGNPDLETLYWIVEGAHERGRRITLAVTNDTDSSRELLATRDPAVYGYTLQVLPAGQNSFTLTLTP